MTLALSAASASGAAAASATAVTLMLLAASTACGPYGRSSRGQHTANGWESCASAASGVAAPLAGAASADAESGARLTAPCSGVRSTWTRGRAATGRAVAPAAATPTPLAAYEGEFDSGSVVVLIRQRLSAIRACYERELRIDRNLSGKVVVAFTIQPSGAVTDVTAVENTSNNTAVAACVLGVVGRFHFSRGPLGGPVTFSYPFFFAPQDDGPEPPPPPWLLAQAAADLGCAQAAIQVLPRWVARVNARPMTHVVRGCGRDAGYDCARNPCVFLGARSTLPPEPSRTAIATALGERGAAVSACGRGWTGDVYAYVTFSASGRATTVSVSGGAPPAALACMEEAIRLAIVPPFVAPTYRVGFPFRLRH